MSGAIKEYVVPAPWPIPREWVGDRCFILCNGESIRAQRQLIPKLRGRFIAIKEAVLLRPDADVLFVAAERSVDIVPGLLPKFTGRYVIARNKLPAAYPSSVKRVCRTKDHTRLCDLPDHVCGYDCGTSAINVAYHFGATEIILLGMDMRGDRWCNGEFKHPMPHIPNDHHRRHASVLPDIAKDAQRRGIRIVNCSPISALTCFEKQPIEAFL